MTGTVFFDIDTELDFLYPAGALYVHGAEAIVDRVAGLNRRAAKHRIPVVFTQRQHPHLLG
jgi:nicotinamidase/pyrazinamidase